MGGFNIKKKKLKTMSSSDWIIIPTIGENKTCSKMFQPTSLDILDTLQNIRVLAG